MDDAEWQVTLHSLREILGSKWSFHILRLLASGDCGFNEMKREIDGMTAAMLSRRLKELGCHGFVERTVEDTTPPTTTYRLTDAGEEFARLLQKMEALTTLRRDGPQDGCKGTSGFGREDGSEVCVTGDARGICLMVGGCGDL